MKTQYRRRPLAAATVVFLLALSAPAAAQSVWTGAVDDDWFNAGNWQDGVVPPNGTNIVEINGPTAIIDGGEATVDNELQIGTATGGNGGLRVRNAAQLTTRTGLIGSAAGSAATITVSDAGSKWKTGNNPISVGVLGHGTFNILAGAEVESSGGSLGRWAGSSGNANINGVGSKWTATDINVGDSGIGILNIVNGGKVLISGGEAVIGYEVGSSGTVAVEDDGSTWNTGALSIGRAGQGALNVSKGGKVTSGTSYVGRESGASGAVTVDGAGSTWTSSNLVVGHRSNGSLLISNGGGVESSTASIAANDGSGEVRVTGTGSTWNVTSGYLAVGNDTPSGGNATLTVSDGGKVSSSGQFAVGFGGGSGHNLATIDGVGSELKGWATGYIGWNMYGELDILNGGTVEIAEDTCIGCESAGVVKISGTGTSLQIGGQLKLGGVFRNPGAQSGDGKLDISSAGRLMTLDDSFIGADDVGDIGVVSIDGVGSVWEASDTVVNIGQNGTGFLTVRNGASFKAADSSIGFASQSAGVVIVDGPGSQWHQSGHLVVGAGGGGGANILNGGSLTVRLGTTIGMGAGGSGDLLIDGPHSTAQLDGFLTVGDFGRGTLSVLSGATLDASVITIAQEQAGLGLVVVDGSGSILNAGQVAMGDGTGDLTLSNGGVLNADSVSLNASDGIFSIGAGRGVQATAAGVLNAPSIDLGIDLGSSTVLFNHTGNVDGSDVLFGSRITGSGSSGGRAAVIHAGPGKTVMTGVSDYTGRTQVTNGELRVDGALGDTRVTVEFNGVLSGQGSIGGFVEAAEHGTLAGTQGSTLTMRELWLDFDGNVSASLGAIGHDPALFKVLGDLTLDGTLQVKDLGGFGAGIYRLFDYGGALTDNGLEIGEVPAGVPVSDLLVQTSVGQQVNLVSLGGQPLSFWDGGDVALHNNGAIDGGAGQWRAQGNDNWTTANGAVNGDVRPQPVFAIFQGQGARVTVDVTDGSVQTSGMQFAADGYRIDGDLLNLAGTQNVIRVGDGTAAGSGYTATIASLLTGSGGLTKTDLGTLVLSNGNTYTGDTRIDAGVLEVSSDANLGDVSGKLVFNGGTLRTATGFASERDVVLAGAGTFDVTSEPLFLSDAIEGDGRLIKEGVGALILTGNNTYAGGTIVREGALQVGNGGGTGSIVGDVFNEGSLDFARNDTLTYGGKITGSGDVGIGAMTLVVTGDSAYTGGTVLAGGTLQLGDGGTSGSIVGDVRGDAGTLSFNRSDTFDFSGKLLDDLEVRQAGTGTTVMTGEHGYTGATQVAAGTLRVNGSIASSALVTVGAGATLAGTGTVSDTIVNGTLAPGNSIGTLTVQGDLTQGSSSIYTAELGAGNGSDQVRVTGQATIENGATLRLLGQASAGSHYTVLTADGGLSGSYRLQDGGALSRFLSVSAAYDATHAYLDVAQVRDFAAAASTRNQAATAGGLDSLSNDAALHKAIANLADDATARGAFDQLSGEAHASARGAWLEESRYVREAASQRARTASDDLAPATWGQLYGAWGRARGDGNAAEGDIDRSGLLLGHEVNLGGARFGALAGTARNRMQIDGRKSKIDSDGWHLGAYAGLDHGAWRFDGGLAYSRYEVDSERGVRAVGLDEKLRAGYDASTLQAFAEAGYGIDKGNVRYEPFAGIAHVNAHSDAFAERGGQAALRGDAEDTRVTLATIGLRADGETGNGAARLHGGIAWRHAFGDETPTADLAFAGGDNFTVAGAPIARDAALLEAGVDWRLGRRARLSLDYRGSWSKEIREHGAQAQLEVRF